MAVVYAEVTYSTTPTAWITGSGDTTSPWYWVDGHLTNWVNGINNASLITIVQRPNQATAYTASLYCSWLLGTPEAGANTGIQYMARNCGNTTTAYASSYQSRTAGSGNNGFGTFTSIGTTVSRPYISGANKFFVAYDFGATLPWFWCGNVVQNGTAADSCSGQLIARLDRTSTGAVSNSAPWLTMSYDGTTAVHQVPTSQSSAVTPWPGLNSSGPETAYNALTSWPDQNTLGNSVYTPDQVVGNDYYLGFLDDRFALVVGDSTPASPTYLNFPSLTVDGYSYKRISPLHYVRVA